MLFHYGFFSGYFYSFDSRVEQVLSLDRNLFVADLNVLCEELVIFDFLYWVEKQNVKLQLVPSKIVPVVNCQQAACKLVCVSGLKEALADEVTLAAVRLAGHRLRYNDLFETLG